MEEVVVTERQRRSRAPLIVALVVVVVAAAIAYLLLRGGPKADPARYLPKEVAMAATFDLTSSADKDAALDVIRGILKDVGVDKPEEELYRTLGDALKLDFKKDVLAHLNGTAAVAVLPEMNGMIPVVVAAICAKGDDDAAALVETLEKKLSRNKVASEKRTYKGYSYRRIPVGGSPDEMSFGPRLINYVGAVDAAVVYATSEGGFRKVVDTIKGGPSLLDDSNFTRLRETGPSTFSTVFFSGPGYYKLISPMMSMGMGMMGGEMPPEFKEEMENVVAVVGSADANAQGLKLSAVGVTKKPGRAYESRPLADMAAQFPADARIACAFNSWDKMWLDLKKGLSNPMLNSEISQMTSQAKQATGIDPFADFLDRLTGFAAYYVPRKAASSEALPGAITFVLTVDKPSVVRRSIAKLHGFAAMAGQMKVTKLSVAGNQVSVMPLSGEDAKLGDVILGNKLIIVISGPGIAQAMGGAISAAQGKGSSLADSEGYKLVKAQLPDKGLGLFYTDIGGVVNVFKDDIPADDRKKVQAVFKRVGWIGCSGEAHGRESNSVVFIPFKK